MDTERISTDFATIGMVVANDIFTRKNQLLISKYSTLTDRNILQLKLYGIKEIQIVNLQNKYYLDDYKENFADNVSEKNESDYFLKVRETKEFVTFKSTILDSAESMKNHFNRLVEHKNPIDTSTLLAEIEAILKVSRNGIHVMDMLNCMREFSDLTYIHSINVALICNVIGRWMNLSKHDIRILTLSGLLHDIGKVLIPPEIIFKPSTLTTEEYSEIKTHTILGYNILRDEDLDKRIKIAALMHHEKCDRSGYPLRLSGDHIDSFAKIVAIADVYDAMTSVRVYRSAICPFEVIEDFEFHGLQKYDPSCLLTFLDRMVHSYIHNWVLLSNQEKAEIVMINKSSLSKPLVCTQNKIFIDLSQNRNINIKAMI